MIFYTNAQCFKKGEDNFHFIESTRVHHRSTTAQANTQKKQRSEFCSKRGLNLSWRFKESFTTSVNSCRRSQQWNFLGFFLKQFIRLWIWNEDPSNAIEFSGHFSPGAIHTMSRRWCETTNDVCSTIESRLRHHSHAMSRKKSEMGHNVSCTIFFCCAARLAPCDLICGAYFFAASRRNEEI